MRKVVRELIEPTILKANESFENCQYFKTSLEAMKEQISILEVALLDKNKKLNVFDQINERFLNNEKQFKQVDAKIEAEIKRMEVQFENLCS